jgi:DNA-binding NarL/FixJ family response regulator
MDINIDWYYLKRLPDNAPKKYLTVSLAAKGFSNKEIAEIRCVAVGTVKNQMRAIMLDVGAKNRAHLIHLAHQAGIL